MIDLETKIMMGIFIILLFFTQFKYSLYFLFFWIFIYLFGFFFTSIGLDLDILKLEKSEIYFKESTGNYSTLFTKLNDFKFIKNKFKLPADVYYPFGIFYDDPQEVKDVNQLRCIYGIIKPLNNNDKTLIKEEEFKDYLKSNEFKIKTLYETQCLNGSYQSMFSIQNSFIFISKIIIEMTTMKFFRRLFMPKWKENKIKIARQNYKKHYGVIEIIRQNKIDIYIPVENEKDFFFHSNATAPGKAKNK